MDDLVDALHYFSTNSSWRNTDFQSAHRLGRTRREKRLRNYGQQETPRALIVTFCHVDDKVLILRDRGPRKRLRERGIGVSADLTPRQRERLQHFRHQGRVTYYKNGKLHVQNSHAQTHEDNSSQRHYDNRSEERGFSDVSDQLHVRHADRRVMTTKEVGFSPMTIVNR